jgi:hypothetical protein
MITAMKFKYKGRAVHIGRDRDGYVIVIDDVTVDAGWARASAAKAMAITIIDDWPLAFDRATDRQ